MSFLEKNLENIIFRERAFCYHRGLQLDPYQAYTYRQLNLAPYGIADLIEIGRPDYDGQIRARVIECKRNTLDLTTYGQASRYQNALARIFGCCSGDFVFEKVLIGQQVDARNDFWAVVANDPDCSVYTYDYRGDGIHFRKHHAFSAAGKAYAEHICRPTVERLFEVLNSMGSGPDGL